MDRKLLLVDDEEGIRRVLAISLSDSGYQVFTAESGEQAFEIFRREAPPIVLTDIRMSGTDGSELLHKIKHQNIKSLPLCPDELDEHPQPNANELTLKGASTLSGFLFLF